MSDIVDRIDLSSPYSFDGTTNSNNNLLKEARDEITRLRQELIDVKECLAHTVLEQDYYEQQHAAAIEALKPFIKFARFAIEPGPEPETWIWLNEYGWERFSNWFGPSEFGELLTLDEKHDDE
jgi:hypothetical protein